MGWFGRQMTSYSKNGKTITNTYDVEGIRGSKTVNGSKTTYQYLDGKLYYEKRGDGRELYYFYDGYGNLVMIRTIKGTADDTYYVTTNSQGDVIGLYTSTGSLAATYEYDAWGNATITKPGTDGTTIDITNSTEEHIGLLNPIRYRGYFYDADMGLYYLQSRYYDASIGRFINADLEDVITVTPTALTDKNLFSYCDNNPITRADDGGEFWHIVAGAAVGVVTQYISDVAINLIEGKSFTEALKPTSTWADYGAAALSGALAATGIGAVAAVGANAAIGGTTYLVNCEIKGEEANRLDFAMSIGVGAISGITGGKGADGRRLRGIARTSRKILKTTMSPKKIAMYSAKLGYCKKEMFVGIGRTFLAGGSGNGFNYWRKKRTGSGV